MRCSKAPIEVPFLEDAAPKQSMGSNIKLMLPHEWWGSCHVVTEGAAHVVGGEGGAKP